MMSTRFTIPDLYNIAVERNAQKKNGIASSSMRERKRFSPAYSISDLYDKVHKNNMEKYGGSNWAYIDKHYGDVSRSDPERAREYDNYITMFSSMSNSGESVLDEASYKRAEEFFDKEAISSPKGKASGRELLSRYGITMQGELPSVYAADPDGLMNLLIKENQKYLPTKQETAVSAVQNITRDYNAKVKKAKKAGGWEDFTTQELYDLYSRNDRLKNEIEGYGDILGEGGVSVLTSPLSQIESGTGYRLSEAVARTGSALHDDYNTSLQIFKNRYAIDQATALDKNFEKNNEEYVKELNSLTVRLDEQIRVLRMMIDRGMYGENTEAVKQELSKLETMRKNTEIIIAAIKDDTKKKQEYFNRKYKELDTAPSEYTAKYGDRGWEQMNEEQRADLIALLYKDDTILFNASDYFNGRLTKIDTEDPAVDVRKAAEYNALVDEVNTFIGEGGTVESYCNFLAGIADGETEFDYTDHESIIATAKALLERIEANRDMMDKDTYLELWKMVSRIVEDGPEMRRRKYLYDILAEEAALEKMSSEEIGDEIVKLEKLLSAEKDKVVAEQLEGLINKAKLQMVGKTDKERAKKYREEIEEYKNIDSCIDNVESSIEDWTEKCEVSKAKAEQFPLPQHKNEYYQAKKELERAQDRYKELVARKAELEKNREYYELLESLDTEWKEKQAGLVERALWTIGDIGDSFMREWMSTVSQAADVLNLMIPDEFPVLNPFAAGAEYVLTDKDTPKSGFVPLKFVKNTFFDKDGDFDFSISRGWNETKEHIDEYLTEGGISKSEFVKKTTRTGEFAPDELKHYRPSFDNDFTQFANDVAEGIGALAPNIALAIATSGGSAVMQGVIIGTSTYHSSYNEARDNGATTGEANAYAFLTGCLAGLSEIVIGMPLDKAAGIIGKPVSNFISGIDNPALRGGIKRFCSFFGEYAEEGIESIFETLFKNATYDPDATLDWSEVAYEGLVGGTVGAMLTGTDSLVNNKANAADMDHVKDIIARAESISSFAEGQAFVQELTSLVQMMESCLDSGDVEYSENLHFLKTNYDVLEQVTIDKIPELVAQNGDIGFMREKLTKLIESENGDGKYLASVFAETEIQLYDAILTKTDLDPEVRAKLEAQRGELTALREELGLDDYSEKRAEGEVSTKNSSQDTDNALDAEVETTPTLDLDSIARSSFDRVNSSTAELNRVVAEMRADGENVETYIPTERTRITDALARAIANSKYANVKGGNRGILSYLDAAEIMQADPDHTRRMLAAEYLTRKAQAESGGAGAAMPRGTARGTVGGVHASSASVNSYVRGASPVSSSVPIAAPSNSVEKVFVDKKSRSGIIDSKKTASETKVVWCDKPHTNKTPGHWETICDRVERMRQSGQYAIIYVNKGLSNELRHPFPNRRPDIMAVRHDGKIDQVEVPSKTDKTWILKARMEDSQRIMRDRAGDTEIEYIKEEYKENKDG